MPLSTRIAAHLPFLRRYGRALTGSQSAGDAYVAATLEALIADVSIFPQASSDRVALYKVFCHLYGSTAVDPVLADSANGWEQRAAANLALVPTRARQAFLLASVESFARTEVAEILDCALDEVTRLIAEASAEIARQLATDVMIVEDEPLIAMDIEQLVLDQRSKPRLILADIQLADGSSGLEAMNEILAQESVPVIFITAFPERLLTGERSEPTFLVTKPFNPDMVKALIGQALFFQQSEIVAA
jgi:DNA-directed RNA polymerase specialized sigma24 family protein